MARNRIKRLLIALLVAAGLIAGAWRAWEWLQPQRAFGSVEGLMIYVQNK